MRLRLSKTNNLSFDYVTQSSNKHIPIFMVASYMVRNIGKKSDLPNGIPQVYGDWIFIFFKLLAHPTVSLLLNSGASKDNFLSVFKVYIKISGLMLMKSPQVVQGPKGKQMPYIIFDQKARVICLF